MATNVPVHRTRTMVRRCVGPVLATVNAVVVNAVVRPWTARRGGGSQAGPGVGVRPGMIQLPAPFDDLPVPPARSSLAVRRPPTTIEGVGRPARLPHRQPDGPVPALPVPARSRAVPLDRAYVEGGIRRLEELLGAPLPVGTFDDEVIAGLFDPIQEWEGSGEPTGPDPPAPPVAGPGRPPGS